MVGTITPLVQEALVTMRWFKSMLAYTLGSLAAATLVGLVLGAIGAAASFPAWAWWSVPVLGLLLAATEFEILPRPRPVIRRQTQQRWRLARGEIRAAFWWGADLGNGFTTTANYHSVWLFVLVCILVADPVASALLYVAYGLGRSALVWTAPLLRAQALHSGFDLAPALMHSGDSWHRLHASVLLAACVLLVTRL